MNAQTVTALVRFQKTGTGFEEFWNDMAAHVDRSIRSRLHRHLVRGWKTSDDLTAVDEVTIQVMEAIYKLGRRAATGGFVRSPGRNPLDRLRAWLYTIARNETANYCRKFRPQADSRTKCRSFTDLELNDQPGVDSRLASRSSTSPEADVADRETRAIVNSCVGRLPECEQALYRLLFEDSLSQHEVGRRLGVSPATVCRHRQNALVKLKGLLESRGVMEA